jgi:hypothetical protein
MALELQINENNDLHSLLKFSGNLGLRLVILPHLSVITRRIYRESVNATKF